MSAAWKISIGVATGYPVSIALFIIYLQDIATTASIRDTLKATSISGVTSAKKRLNM
jgi:hypothetical protein